MAWATRGPAMTMPLTDDQRSLFDTLLEQVETVRVNGHTIAVASAPAPNLVEELSSVAHRLRDLLVREPELAAELASRLATRLAEGARLAAELAGGAAEVELSPEEQRGLRDQ